MENLKIRYVFHFAEHETTSFDFEFDAKTMELIVSDETDLPEWTKLECNKCPHCPLKVTEHQYCPAAVSLSAITDRFDEIISYDEIDVEVILPSRTVKKTISAQEAISSLFGLLISCSGCPYTAFFKVMGRYHLPFSTDEETLFRAPATYLLMQYLRSQANHSYEFGLDGLKLIYDNMRIVNASMAERLRSASKSDTPANAISILDSFAQSISMEIEDSFETLSEIFNPIFFPASGKQ